MDFKLLGTLRTPPPLLLPPPEGETCSCSLLNCASLEEDVIDINGAGSPVTVSLWLCVYITGEKEAVPQVPDASHRSRVTKHYGEGQSTFRGSSPIG